MKKVMEQAGINDADTVLVTGYSACLLYTSGRRCRNDVHLYDTGTGKPFVLRSG